METSIIVEWWDDTVGGWFDLGEAYNEDAARARIAGLRKSDDGFGLTRRYRIVITTIITEV